MVDLEEYKLDEETIKGINRLASLVNKADESGILDIVETLFDEGVIEKLLKYIVTPDLLIVLDRLDILTKLGSNLLRSIEYENETKSLISLLNEMRKDPEIRLGLARLLYFLKLLGKLKIE